MIILIIVFTQELLLCGAALFLGFSTQKKSEPFAEIFAISFLKALQHSRR
jgi:hypothetical protein